MTAIPRLLCGLALGCVVWILGNLPPTATPAAATPMDTVEAYIANRPGLSGVYSLETGAEALRARAWLVDHARRSIEVQYFIWSTDNVGTLAAHALLRAADRGVKVRVIVDDLLIDAYERTLAALAAHENVEIRIYNPSHAVGVRWYERIWRLLTDFRGSNQRMHDKSFIVDGQVAIIGGRNMATEYFDYNREYNFRDRDALVLGHAVGAIQKNFEAFWASHISVPVDRLIGRDEGGSTGLLTAAHAAAFRAELDRHAASPDNFEPAVRDAIAAVPGEFDRLATRIRWSQVEFIHDQPGKNDAGPYTLDGGSRSAEALARQLRSARSEVLIQSPYLVMSDEALALFAEARARGVAIRVNTNSLAATDNIEAFSGYLAQRDTLLELGVELREYRPDAAVQRASMRPYLTAGQQPPITSLHAKTMVVDGEHVFIGTYNLDPRSQNLNTEIGIAVHDRPFAQEIRAAIMADMGDGSSWDAARDDPDSHAGWGKRLRAWLYSWLPLRALL